MPLTTFTWVHAPLPPQPMLWFTYYKDRFSTFVFTTQNRAFMLRSCPLGTASQPSMHLTQSPLLLVKSYHHLRRPSIF